MKLLDDIRYSVRLLIKTPYHTGTTLFILVLGLALYIGNHTFAQISIDKSMPFPAGDRYVRLKTINPQFGQDEWNNVFDLYTYQRLIGSSDNYQLLGAYHRSNIVVDDTFTYPQRVRTATMSHNLLSATGVQPLMGRLFTEDEAQSLSPVAVISFSLWRDYFNSDPNVIGRTSDVNGVTTTIIGVMPPEFSFPYSEELWLPLNAHSIVQPNEGLPISMAGILAKGRSLNNAELELENVLTALHTEFPNEYQQKEAVVSHFAERNSVLNTGFFSLILAYIVLALATTNLTSLLSMRALARKQELAIRASLGANNWEITKQVLLESFLICITGFCISLVCSLSLLALMDNYLRLSNSPFWYIFELNFDAVLTGFGLTLAIWLLTGLLVSYQVWRSDPNSQLASSNKATGRATGGKANRIIVTIEVVLSCFILVATIGTISLLRETNVTDFGVNPDNKISARFGVEVLAQEDERSRDQFIEQLSNELVASPNINSVSITSALPGSGGIVGTYRLEEELVLENADSREHGTIWVSNNYFTNIDIDIVRGRSFDTSDTVDSERVVIINQDFAQRLWPDQSPLNRYVVSKTNNREERFRVVGVIPPTLMQTNSTAGMFNIPNIYRPISQNSPNLLSLVIEYMPNSEVSKLAEQIKLVGASLDRRITIENIEPLASNFVTGDADRVQIVAELFSIAALVLAAIGVYAVLGRSITERTREIGVQRALGSSNAQVFFNFGKQGLFYLGAGLIFGGGPVVILWAVTLSLFSTANSTTTPFMIIPALLLVGVIMFLVIATACYIPTRQALIKEPGDALRYD